MDPQAPNIQEPSNVEPTTASASETKVENSKNNNSITVISMAVFVLLALGAVVFLYLQNQQLKKMIVSTQSTLLATPTPVATPNPDLPVVSSPSANMKVTSPLKITGTVPAGWMFEGVFPIKLIDSKNKILAQGQGKEKVAGSWQSGSTVDFTATLTFTSATGSGTLILQNDNPSGLPTNDKTFEIPVKF